MVIDFHTHIFPEKIAPKTIETLENRAHIKAACAGTLESLKESMKRNGVDYSVVLPVVTKPSQFDSINAYSQSINNQDGIIAFDTLFTNNHICMMKLLLPMLPPSNQKSIAIYIKYMAIYEVRSRRRKEHRRSCKVLGVTPTVSRGLCQDKAVKGML